MRCLETRCLVPRVSVIIGRLIDVEPKLRDSGLWVELVLHRVGGEDGDLSSPQALSSAARWRPRVPRSQLAFRTSAQMVAQYRGNPMSSMTSQPRNAGGSDSS